MSRSPTVDPRPQNPKACCILCATWVCHECWDWHRTRADRNYSQYCTNCGGVEGQFTAVRHSKPHGSWRAHVFPRPIPTTLPKTWAEIHTLRFFE